MANFEGGDAGYSGYDGETWHGFEEYADPSGGFGGSEDGSGDDEARRQEELADLTGEMAA
jgi:hypothetical protein